MYVQTREMLDLAMEMRRHVRREFEVDLKLSRPDLIEQLVHYAGRSCNDELRSLAAHLLPLLPEQTGSAETTPEHQVQYYRGAPVSSTARSASVSDAAEPRQRPAGRIYRGQRVL